MKALIVYRPNSEFARRAEEYAQNFERTRGQKLEMLDLDSTEGTRLVELYDIMQYPCLVVLKEDGQLIKDWQGVDQLPLMNELAVYLNS